MGKKNSSDTVSGTVSGSGSSGGGKKLLQGLISNDLNSLSSSTTSSTALTSVPEKNPTPITRNQKKAGQTSNPTKKKDNKR